MTRCLRKIPLLGRMRCLLLGLLLPVAMSHASEPESSLQQPNATAYRRVFVPADAPETWPVDSQRYLPIPQTRFLQWVEQNRASANDRQPSPVSISKAVYRAELKGDTLRGTAELAVVLPGEQARLLPLSPLNLAVQSATWQASPAQAAAFGLWQHPKGLTESALLVPKSDTLRLRWLLAAQQSDSTQTSFELKMPVVVPQTFELLLPANHSASLSPGQRLQTEPAPQEKTRWVFQLAACESHQLRIERPLVTRAVGSLPLVSQATSYQIKTPGLKIVSQFRLDARESQIRELTAQVSAGMRIVEVTVDQHAVPWQRIQVAGENRLTFLRPPSESPQRIEIRALAKFPTNLAQELPRIRLREVAWTEGTTSLLVSPKLELRLLNPSQATLLHIVGIADSASDGKVFRLQEWSDVSTIEVMVARRKPRIAVRTATTLDLGRDEANASIVALFSSANQKQFQIQATIADLWSIESVTTTPPSALAEWHLDKNKTLRLQLKNSITNEAPLRVEIKARQTTGQPLLPATTGALKPIDFLDVNTTAQFLLLRTRETQPLVFEENVERTRRTFDQLTPEDADLFPVASAGTLLEISTLDESEKIELRPEPARYEADVKLDVHVAEDSITHRYRIAGTTLSGAVSEIIFECDEPLPESLRWQLDEQRNTLSAKPDENQNRSQPSPTSAVRYLLKFPIPRTGKFHLEASYATTAKPTETCNAIRLPHAKSWSGRVLLRGALDRLPVVDQGWTPTVCTPGEPNDGLPVLGCYRLGPEASRQSRSKRLQLRRTSQPVQAPKALAWLAEYRTLQAANGAAIHLANFSLENLGADQAEVVLPQNAKLLEAWLDNRQLNTEEIGAQGATCRFRLTPDQRWPSLVLKYSTHDTPLGDAATLQPVLPRCSFPVNRSRWTLWAPEQYQIDNTRQHDASQLYPWWKRVFGPLARSRQDSIFNPLQAKQWKQLFAEPLVGQQTKQKGEALARQLASRLQACGNETWGQLLSEWVDQEVDQEQEVGQEINELLRIDRRALLAKQIEAKTPCRQLINAGHPTPTSEAQPLPLSSYGLALLVSPGSIVLTSEDRVALWRDQLHPTERSGVFVLAADGLINTLEQLRKKRSTEMVDLVRWKKFPTQPKSVWGNFPTTTLTDVGRYTQTVEFLEKAPTLVVRRTFVGRALWYAVFLLTLVLGVWQLAHFPNMMILVGSIAGATCLIVPIPWLPIPQAAFLGLVAAALLQIVFRSAREDEKESPKLRRPVHSLVVLLLGTLALGTTSLQAQPTPHATTADVTRGVTHHAKLPKVLVPIDAQGNRQGEDVYLSVDFLQKIQKAVSQDTQPQWVIREAKYQAKYQGTTLPRDQRDDSPDNLNEPWTLLWKIESFTPNARFVLPLHQNEASWQADAHRLDGVPTELDWHPTGKSCSLTLPAPGIHWLKLVALPKLQLDDRSATFQLHVPALPGAQLNLADVPRFANLRVASATQIDSNEDPEQIQFVLSPSNVIKMQWNPEIFKDAAPAWERLEQRSWLHVDPAGAHLDVQLALNGSHATSRFLELEISPQLKLVPPEKNALWEVVAQPTRQQPTRLRLKIRQGLPEEFVLPLRFDLQRTVSVGRLFFPRVQLVGQVPDQKLFAVSVSAGLSYDESLQSSLQSIEPSEFSASWKKEASDPLYAYALGQEDPEWSLRVWPDPQSVTAQQTLRLLCLPSQVRVEFEAVLENHSGLSHRLLVPKSLAIEAITVESQNEQTKVPVRWSRASETQAVVFLGRPFLQPHRIQLRGHVETPKSREIEIPKIQLLTNERSEIHWDLYRAEEVQVRWLEPKPTIQETLQPRVSNDRAEIHVEHASWRSEEADPLPKIRIEKNKPVFDITSLTTVDLGLAEWSTSMNARIHIRQGVVSRLSLETPKEFLGPYVVTPPQVAVIDEIESTPTGQKITLRLTQPAREGKKIDIRLHGRLQLAADQRVAVPAIRWNGATREEHFVLLPTLINKQPMEWQTSGLHRTTLPKKLQAFVTSSEPALAYHVQQNTFQAAERSYRGTLRNALIRTAKITATLDQQGFLTATAELILQPGRATSCAIELPPSAKLTQLVVGERPARREPLGQGLWKIALGPPFMPRRIVVSYQDQHNLHQEQLLLASPKVLIGDQALPSPQTLWRIRPMTGLLLGKTLGGYPIEAAQFFEEHHRHTRQTLRDAQTQAHELPEREARTWMQTWQSLAQQAKAAQQEYERFAQSEEVSQEGQGLDTPSYPPRLPLALEATLIDAEKFYLSHAGNRLALSVQTGSPQNLGQWLATTALLCGILATVLRLRSKPLWHRQLCQWPHRLALCGGLCWWLLFKPSAVGLLIIVLTLTSLAIQQGRRTRNRRRPNAKTQPALPAS